MKALDTRQRTMPESFVENYKNLNRIAYTLQDMQRLMHDIIGDAYGKSRISFFKKSIIA